MMDLNTYYNFQKGWSDRFKDRNITDTEEHIMKSVISSHLFQLEDNVLEILTKTNNKVYNRKTPFKDIFISNILTFGDNLIYGIWLHNDDFNTDSTHISLMIGDSDGYNTKIFAFNKSTDDFLKNKNRENKHFLMNGLYEERLMNRLRLFICNFLDFLNNPETELITIERTIEQNKKRILRGKRPIPTLHNIRVSGKLKIYLDHLNSNQDFKYTHRFDVRGHWRTLRSDKWKLARGTKIWIPPYIKGQGIYIKKNYEVIESSHKLAKVKR